MNKRLNISKLEKQQARYEARGRLSPSLKSKLVSLITIISFQIVFVL
ncbi:hypothetical protein [Leptospira alexanderi]|nr:hypothetical protein [Leptospira alexanderi]